MILRKYLINFIFLFLLVPMSVQADNFHNSKAIVLDLDSSIKLSNFSFKNGYIAANLRADEGFIQELAWTNDGSQPVIAFEVMILAYDPFNRAMPSTRWMVTGHNSVKWEPLNPGQSSKDGLFGRSTKKVFTAIAYVNTVRYADGTIWTVSPESLLKKLSAVSPFIENIDDIDDVVND